MTHITQLVREVFAYCFARVGHGPRFRFSIIAVFLRRVYEADQGFSNRSLKLVLYVCAWRDLRTITLSRWLFKSQTKDQPTSLHCSFPSPTLSKSLLRSLHTSRRRWLVSRCAKLTMDKAWNMDLLDQCNRAMSCKSWPRQVLCN